MNSLRRHIYFALLLSGTTFYLAEDVSATTPERTCVNDDVMVSLNQGAFSLREDGGGRPGRPVEVDAFQIDAHEVTNRQFEAFVAATGYVTEAERDGGGAVFVSPAALTSANPAQWWRFVEGADWRHPEGPESSIVGRTNAPVVQVTLADAQAYAEWAGGRLPTEIEWEWAARGGKPDGQDRSSWAYQNGKPIANTWQGTFPLTDKGEDTFTGIAPVGCFPANGYGLYDMVGNVWEWTAEENGAHGLVKGGSFLCAANYCANFRPAAFQAQERDLPTSHIGFRTVKDPQ